MPKTPKKFLDQNGLQYFANKLNNYPTNEILGTVIDAIGEEIDSNKPFIIEYELSNQEAQKVIQEDFPIIIPVSEMNISEEFLQKNLSNSLVYLHLYFYFQGQQGLDILIPFYRQMNGNNNSHIDGSVADGEAIYTVSLTSTNCYIQKYPLNSSDTTIWRISKSGNNFTPQGFSWSELWNTFVDPEQPSSILENDIKNNLLKITEIDNIQKYYSLIGNDYDNLFFGNEYGIFQLQQNGNNFNTQYFDILDIIADFQDINLDDYVTEDNLRQFANYFLNNTIDKREEEKSKNNLSSINHFYYNPDIFDYLQNQGIELLRTVLFNLPASTTDFLLNSAKNIEISGTDYYIYYRFIPTKTTWGNFYGLCDDKRIFGEIRNAQDRVLIESDNDTTNKDYFFINYHFEANNIYYLCITLSDLDDINLYEATIGLIEGEESDSYEDSFCKINGHENDGENVCKHCRASLCSGTNDEHNFNVDGVCSNCGATDPDWDCEVDGHVNDGTDRCVHCGIDLSWDCEVDGHEDDGTGTCIHCGQPIEDEEDEYDCATNGHLNDGTDVCEHCGVDLCPGTNDEHDFDEDGVCVNCGESDPDWDCEVSGHVNDGTNVCKHCGVVLCPGTTDEHNFDENGVCVNCGESDPDWDCEVSGHVDDGEGTCIHCGEPIEEEI